MIILIILLSIMLALLWIGTVTYEQDKTLAVLITIVYVFVCIGYYYHTKSPKVIPTVDNRPDTVFYQNYQLWVERDSTWVFDQERLVGIVPNSWTTPLDSLIKKDNE